MQLFTMLINLLFQSSEASKLDILLHYLGKGFFLMKHPILILPVVLVHRSQQTRDITNEFRDSCSF